MSCKAEVGGLGWVLVFRGLVCLFVLWGFFHPTTRDTNSILQPGTAAQPKAQGNAAEFIPWLH